MLLYNASVAAVTRKALERSAQSVGTDMSSHPGTTIIVRKSCPRIARTPGVVGMTDRLQVMVN